MLILINILLFFFFLFLLLFPESTRKHCLCDVNLIDEADVLPMILVILIFLVLFYREAALVHEDLHTSRCVKRVVLSNIELLSRNNRKCSSPV